MTQNLDQSLNATVGGKNAGQTSSVLYQKFVSFMLVGFVVGLILFMVGGVVIYLHEVRSQAMGLASQVVAFRTWISNTGGVWVDNLHPDFPDFLASKKLADGRTVYQKNPALATRELTGVFQSMSSQYRVRVTSDNYRNEKNAPDDFEIGAIEEFKADTDLGYVDGFEGGEYRYVQPIKIVQSCLQCHGDPQKAPRAVIEKYGDRKAFGYKVGDTRGVISVTIPPTALQSAVLNSMYIFLAGGLILGAVILASMTWFKRRISRPLENLINFADQISVLQAPDFEAGIGTIIGGDDDMFDLATALERMNTRLEGFQRGLNCAGDGIAILNAEGRCEYVNNSLAKLLGHPPKHFTGLPFTDVMGRSVFDRKMKSVIALTLSGGDQSWGGWLQFPDKKDRFMSVSCSPVVGQDALIVGIVMVLRDETESFLEKQKTLNNNALLRAVFNAIPDALTVVDTDHRIAEINQGFTDTFLYRDAEAKGKDAAELYHDAGGPGAAPATGEHEQDSGPFVAYYRKKDGQLFAGETVGAEIKMPNGEILGLVELTRDITQRLAQETELVKARDIAVEAHQAKSYFFAKMSHELRTPLNAIIGLSDLMKLEPFGVIGPKYLEYIEDVNKSGKKLFQLIQDVLDISKVDLGELKLNAVDADPHSLVEEVVSLLGEDIDERQITLTVDCDEPGEFPLMSLDPLRIKQALISIIGNAIKFSDNGSHIAVKIGCSGHGRFIRVEDHGRGIREDDIENALQPFGSTKEDYLVHRTDGAGLGLSLTKELIGLHGGTLSIESQPDVGTVVVIQLPCDRCDEKITRGGGEDFECTRFVSPGH